MGVTSVNLAFLAVLYDAYEVVDDAAVAVAVAFVMEVMGPYCTFLQPIVS